MDRLKTFTESAIRVALEGAQDVINESAEKVYGDQPIEQLIIKQATDRYRKAVKYILGIE